MTIKVYCDALGAEVMKTLGSFEALVNYLYGSLHESYVHKRDIWLNY